MTTGRTHHNARGSAGTSTIRGESLDCLGRVVSGPPSNSEQRSIARYFRVRESGVPAKEKESAEKRLPCRPALPAARTVHVNVRIDAVAAFSTRWSRVAT